MSLKGFNEIGISRGLKSYSRGTLTRMQALADDKMELAPSKEG